MDDKCPHCSSSLRKHLNAQGKATVPKPNDVGICGVCGGIFAFTEKGLRIPTDGEMEQLMSDVRVQRALIERAGVPETARPHGRKK